MSETETTPDPYQYYAYLRKAAPVSRAPDNGPWQVARHADVNQVLRDHETFSSDVATQRRSEDQQPSMLFSDPPVHNRLRKLVSRAFKPSHIAAQRGLIEAKCDALMEDMRTHKEVDLVTALAAPLPVTVIANMLGVSGGDMLSFKRWSDTIFSSIGDLLFAEPNAETEQAALEMRSYFTEQIDAIRREPQEHLLGRLVETETEDGKLGLEELLSFCSLLLIAGNETTTGLITASVRIFDEFPETLQQLRSDPSLIPTFIEEALRFYSPFSLTIRKATRDTEIAGVKIGAGELVLPLMASANRDETVFENPDQFIIDRDPNPHLAFGFGIHFCLGAHLARLEGEIAVAGLVQHFQAIRLADANTEMRGLGGPTELRVQLTPV